MKDYKNYLSIVVFIFTMALNACGAITSVSNPPEQTVTASTALVSTNLDAAISSFAVGGFHQTYLSNSCGDDAVNCLTPTNLSGKIYYSGIMVGDQAGYSVGPIVGDIIDPSEVTSFPSEDLLDFDFSEELSLDGEFECCEGTDYPDDADAIASRIESYFGYVDTAFTLSAADGVAEDLVGSHFIRTVYADIDDTDFQQGDLLYSDDGTDFFWCTIAAGCTHTTRPDSPIQYDDVVNYAGTEDGLGNQTIPTFSVDLDDDSQVTLTETDLLANSWAFTVDFDMGDGVVFSEDLTEQDTIAEMVSLFSLAAEPGSSDNGFSASLTAVSTAN
jgi:hypothetical protein